MQADRPKGSRRYLLSVRGWIIIGAVIGSALLIIAIFLSPLVQPSITIDAVTTRAYGCPARGPVHWTLSFLFVLVNAGGGNGIAKVALYNETGTIASFQYLVPAHSIAAQNETFRTMDFDHWPCPPAGTLGVGLLSVTRV
jgi:hypothetical protein